MLTLVDAGGRFGSYNGNLAIETIRLNSDGSVDATFASGNGFDNSVDVISIAEDDSGDIYVGGSFSRYNGNTAHNIIRLNSDGSMDRTFATESGFNVSVEAIATALDGSGDALIGGRFTSY